MKSLSRLLLSSALSLLVLSSACNLPGQPPALPSETSASDQVTSTPISIDIVDTNTPMIPITGMDVVSMQCQFCVNQEAHAVLIMSNQAFFNVADPESGVTCLSAQEVNGRRILLCRGAQNASFTLNVCVDQSNCLEFPITLQPCPLVPAAGSGTPAVSSTFVPLPPVILTPRNTLRQPTGVPATSGPVTGGTATTAPSTPLPTSTDPGAVTPVPTVPTTEPPPPPEPTSTTEPATVEPPPPPPQPSATSGQTGGGGGGNSDRLVICHVSQGNSEDRETITVSRSSWENVHSQHGDSMGAC